jgi:hypothetical protein
LNGADARYLLAGAYAVLFHTEPRYTKDLDVWVEGTEGNARRVWEALRVFGAPLEGVRPEDFTSPDVIYQIGMEPNRIDILVGIEGVTFAEAWERRIATTYGGEPTWVLSLDDIRAAKAACGRPQDLLDLERLDRARRFRDRDR